MSPPGDEYAVGIIEDIAGERQVQRRPRPVDGGFRGDSDRLSGRAEKNDELRGRAVRSVRSVGIR